MFSLLPVISVGINVLVLIVSIAGFLKVMKNDLVHVQKSLDKIETKINDMDKRFDYIAERVSKIEGRLK